MDIQYGKTYETTLLDENGSFMEVETTILDTRITEEKVKIEQRFKVYTQQEELTSYLQFREKTKALREASFGIEHTAKANMEGAYYVIWRYCAKKG